MSVQVTVKGGGGRAVRLISKQVEKTGNSAKARLGICISLRTATARIRRDADEEHQAQDPKLRMQINLRVLMSACAYV